MTTEQNTEFYANAYKQISAYVRKLSSTSEHIDEVTQEVFLKIHHSIGTLKNEEKLKPWLNRIVYTTLMDYYKREKNYVLENTMGLELQQDEAYNHNDELINCIMGLLQLLPEQERDLLKAVEIDQMKQTEYAKQYNIKLSTVKSRVQRAKQKIKDQISSNCNLQMDKYGNVIDYQMNKTH